MKTALVVRHVVFEGVAGYREPIEAAGYEIERIPSCSTDFTALDLLSPELVVLMGGPMGAYETAAHPWLAAEIAAVRARLDRDLPTLGVCLGSQLVAAALGADVYPGPVREIGFSPLSLTAAGQASPLRHLAGVDVLHWHGDTFDLPPDVELLAASAAYAHQGFRRGANLLALQFHAEMGEDPRFHEWIEEGRDYLAGAAVDPMALTADHDRLGPRAVGAGRAMIAEWLAGL